MMLAYAMKQKDNSTKAGNQMAILEGSMGVGATFGFAFSGISRKYCSLNFSITNYPVFSLFMLAVNL